ARYEQAVRSAGPSQPFAASEAGKAFASPRFRAQAGQVNEPPPPDTLRGGPREAARGLNPAPPPVDGGLPAHSAPPKALDRTERDGVPGFLDRRKANGNAHNETDTSYVDLASR